MTALIGVTVERTFSMNGSFLTGLPGAKTYEARGQDLGDLGQTAVAGGIRRDCAHRFWPIVIRQQPGHSSHSGPRGESDYHPPLSLGVG
jgi:hypothetical protein